jgi:hypothetical protein
MAMAPRGDGPVAELYRDRPRPDPDRGPIQRRGRGLGSQVTRTSPSWAWRELAKPIGVSQSRVAGIVRSRNFTLDVLGEYADAVGGQLEVNVG